MGSQALRQSNAGVAKSLTGHVCACLLLTELGTIVSWSVLKTATEIDLEALFNKLQHTTMCAKLAGDPIDESTVRRPVSSFSLLRE